jgi:MFS family permease
MTTPDLRASKDADSDVSSPTDQSTIDEKLERHNSDIVDAGSVLDGTGELATSTDHDIEMGGVISHKSTKSSWKDPGPPPDGGLVAWTQAIMAHLVVFNTWGYINSFGVFQTYYVDALRRPPSDISWVGSIQIFLVFFIGTFSGRATDAGYFRLVFTIGMILQAVGIFATSFATTYWQIFLSQGVCQGLANGLMFCPTLALLSTYFSKKRGLALGIAASGSATGGLVFPSIVQQLLPRIGFPWTVRIVGFIVAGTLMIVNTFMRTRLPPRRAGPLVEWAAFREVSYVLFTIGMFLMFLGLYFAFYYVRHTSFLRGNTSR